MFSRVSRLKTTEKAGSSVWYSKTSCGAVPRKALSRTCYVVGGGFVTVSTRNRKTLQNVIVILGQQH